MQMLGRAVPSTMSLHLLALQRKLSISWSMWIRSNPIPTCHILWSSTTPIAHL